MGAHSQKGHFLTLWLLRVYVKCLPDFFSLASFHSGIVYKTQVLVKNDGFEDLKNLGIIALIAKTCRSKGTALKQ